MREQVEQWLSSEYFGDSYRDDVLRYLTRYVGEIKSLFHIISLFSKVKRGKRHLVLALKVLFNFHEAIGYEKAFLDVLHKALPKVKCGINSKIPSEAEKTR